MVIKKILIFLERPKNNVIIILAGMVSAWLIAMTGDLSNVGLGGLAHLFFPIILGLLTLAVYGLFWIFIKKFIWIITIVGTVYNLFLAYQLRYDLI